MPLFVAAAATLISAGNIDLGSMYGLAQRWGANQFYYSAQFPRYHLLSIAIIANNSNYGMQQRHYQHTFMAFRVTLNASGSF